MSGLCGHCGEERVRSHGDGPIVEHGGVVVEWLARVVLVLDGPSLHRLAHQLDDLLELLLADAPPVGVQTAEAKDGLGRGVLTTSHLLAQRDLQELAASRRFERVESREQLLVLPFKLSQALRLVGLLQLVIGLGRLVVEVQRDATRERILRLRSAARLLASQLSGGAIAEHDS